ncbi:MAG: hypothetical protein NVS4B8_29110 [Herpetosiphon sp.]
MGRHRRPVQTSVAATIIAIALTASMLFFRGHAPSSLATMGVAPAASAPAASTSSRAAVRERIIESNEDVGYSATDSNPHPQNFVKVINQTNGKMRIKGKIQLNVIPGADAQPENVAFSYASCTDCQTFAVALQINLISKRATTVAPQNVALALNYQCTRCHTVADAYQYVYMVEDPENVPDDAEKLIKELDKELNKIAHESDLTTAQAEARINAVITRFTSFASTLTTRRDESQDGNSPNAPSPDKAAQMNGPQDMKRP